MRALYQNEFSFFVSSYVVFGCLLKNRKHVEASIATALQCHFVVCVSMDMGRQVPFCLRVHTGNVGGILKAKSRFTNVCF